MRRVKPATLRDYGGLLRESGVAYRRGTRRTKGRLMAGLGDVAIKELRTRDVSRFLRALDDEA